MGTKANYLVQLVNDALRISLMMFTKATEEQLGSAIGVNLHGLIEDGSDKSLMGKKQIRGALSSLEQQSKGLVFIDRLKPLGDCR